MTETGPWGVSSNLQVKVREPKKIVQMNGVLRTSLRMSSVLSTHLCPHIHTTQTHKKLCPKKRQDRKLRQLYTGPPVALPLPRLTACLRACESEALQTPQQESPVTGLLEESEPQTTPSSLPCCSFSSLPSVNFQAPCLLPGREGSII